MLETITHTGNIEHFNFRYQTNETFTEHKIVSQSH